MNLATARVLAYTKLSGRRLLSSVSGGSPVPALPPEIWRRSPGRLNQTENTMYKIRNAVLGIVTLTSVSGAVLAVPTQAAEQYIVGVHRAVARALVRLSLRRFISQEDETLVRQSLRQPLLRQLLCPRGLLQLLGLLRSSLLEFLRRQPLWP